MEDQPNNINGVDIEIASDALVELLGAERFCQLPLLIKDVIDETGFGDVKLVIAEGRVVRLKKENSY